MKPSKNNAKLSKKCYHARTDPRDARTDPRDARTDPRDIALLAIGSGAFSGGSKSVFYSSGIEALTAARAGRGCGILLENTIGGRILNGINAITFRCLKKKLIPEIVWKIVSFNFAANAKGVARVCLRNPRVDSIWITIERKLLSFRKIPIIEF